VKKFVYFTRPDNSRIAIDPFYVTAVRPPLKNEQGKCVLEPSRQQVLETFEETVRLLESAGEHERKHNA
jgi:hypothetical protein